MSTKIRTNLTVYNILKWKKTVRKECIRQAKTTRELNSVQINGVTTLHILVPKFLFQSAGTLTKSRKLIQQFGSLILLALYASLKVVVLIIARMGFSCYSFMIALSKCLNLLEHLKNLN